jgi:hypothetical protein
MKPWWWVFAQSVLKITIEVTPQNLNAEEMEDLAGRMDWCFGDIHDPSPRHRLPPIKSSSQRQVPSWDSAVGT